MPSFLDRCIDFHANLHPAIKWGGYAIIAATLSLTALPVAYKYARAWRMEQNLDAARQAAAAGLHTEARDRALSVVRFNPKNMEAMRVFAHAVYALKEPASQEIACVMLANPEGNESDKVQAFDILSQRSPMALVGAAWNQIGPERQKDPQYRLPFVRRLIAQSHYSEAANLLQQKTEGTVLPPALEAEWLRLLSLMNEAEHHEKAQEQAIRFFNENLPEAELLLSYLTPLPLSAIQAPLAEAARAWQERTPQAGPTAKLEVARLHFATDSSARSDITAAAIRTHRDSAPGPLCRWLVATDQLDTALELGAPPKTSTDLDWFMAYNAALTKAERWQDLLVQLENPSAPIPRLELCAERAIAAHKLGDHARRAMEWSNALAEAAGDSTRNGFLVLAAMAEKAGLSDDALAAMSRGVRMGRGLIPIHERLKPLISALASRGRGKELLQIFTTLMQFEGGNPLVLTNYCYLGCLYGVIEPDFAITRMEAVQRAIPNAVPIRAVLATAWLMKDQPKKAEEVMAMEKFDWLTAAPGYRAVYGTTMYLLEKNEEAARILQGLPWDELLPRETNVFFGMLSKARIRQGKRDAPPWMPNFQPRTETDIQENLPAATQATPALPNAAVPPPAAATP